MVAEGEGGAGGAGGGLGGEGENVASDTLLSTWLELSDTMTQLSLSLTTMPYGGTNEAPW